MTWNPLKRSHLTTKPSSAPNLIASGEQRDLELTFARLQGLEENTRRLQKEVKKYSELVVNAYKLENKLSSDLANSPVCHNNTELRKIVEDYLSVLVQLEGSVQSIGTVCQRAVIDPTKKYGNYFQDMAQALHRRDQAISEWQKISSKVAKLSQGSSNIGRMATDIVKVEAAKKSLNDTTRELNSIHGILVNELPTFYCRRGEYFHPCLQALARAQLDYYGEMTRLFTLVLNSSTSYIGTSPQTKRSSMSPSSSPSKSDAEFQENVRKKLGAIKALSIVKPTCRVST
ncbi:bridging integrator 3-like [Ischnura elegans]|uniref:bridging integrator 3-like n=1 Tax=Ischnura elegans TaxID=197161 RepID=UPI001ED8BF2C|nr:bridging integrator 3-like [Ischnura elegans]